jgi:hypothetical protein
MYCYTFQEPQQSSILLSSLLFTSSNMSKNVRITSGIVPSDRYLVENNGFEPLTPCVQGRCSSQLS